MHIVRGTALRPFSASGYEIFDEDFRETGEVVIWSRSPLTPCLGDRFNIETLRRASTSWRWARSAPSPAAGWRPAANTTTPTD